MEDVQDILGPKSLPNNTVAGYTFVPQDYLSYEWIVTNGIVMYGTDQAAIVVQWPAAGTGTIEAKFTSAQGEVSSIVINVDITAGGGHGH